MPPAVRRRRPATTLPSDIIELEDEEESLNILIHGDSGSGKTPFGASAAKCLILRTEVGTISAQRRGSKAKVWPCPDWNAILKAKEWLENQATSPGGIPFDWVTLDSGTSAQTHLLRHILREEFGRNPTKRDLDLPQIQDHQLWQNQFKRVMLELVDLPVNLCVTALPMLVEMTGDNGMPEEWVLPQFLGQKGAIAWTIAGMFSAGGRVRLVNNKAGKRVQRINWSKQNNLHWGRDRYGALGTFTDNLTLDGLAERVRNTKVAV